MKSDVGDTIEQGLPASKFVVGVDVGISDLRVLSERTESATF